ncbi:MAG: hypothetical protein LBD30_09060 [Verrucomicrobiales bacterium]|jgi:outer membrane protein assembly factor BamE (lipoprotein component of BamABCDE complex)|nr:hypothetical protein [Verrucomicrobiales bacterium]
MKTMVSVLCGAVLLFIISGCSTIESRRTERAEAFAALTKDQQRIVMQGSITEGLTKDAVYIALGRPLRVRQEHMNGVTTESWVYGRMETYSAPRMYVGPVYYGRYGAAPWFYPAYYDNTVSVMKDTFVVYFDTKGKVKGWQEL